MDYTAEYNGGSKVFLLRLWDPGEIARDLRSVGFAPVDWFEGSTGLNGAAVDRHPSVWSA